MINNSSERGYKFSEQERDWFMLPPTLFRPGTDGLVPHARASELFGYILDANATPLTDEMGPDEVETVKRTWLYATLAGQSMLEGGCASPVIRQLLEQIKGEHLIQDALKEGGN